MAKWADKNNFDKLKRMEGTAREKYIKKFSNIAKYVEIENCDHIDLFFYRETKQKILLQYICDGKEEITEFGNSQLELSKELIELADPVVIIVANACASQIFEKKYKVTFNKEKGYHEIKLNNQTIPVFLGSTITGQRPIDRYSLLRLKWHLKKAIGK